MMLINNEALMITEDDLELFLEDLNKFPKKNEIEEKTTEIVNEYFIECYQANVRLTEMVADLFQEEEVYPLVIMNYGECDDFNELSFSLMTYNEDYRVKKRDELKFYDLCDICFGSIVGLQDRIDIYFEGYD